MEQANGGTPDDHSDRILESLFQPIPEPESARFRNLVQFCDRHSASILAELPFVFAEIADHAGYDPALRYLRTCCGGRAFLPRFRGHFARHFGVEFNDRHFDKLIRLNNDNPYLDIPSSGGIFTVLRRVAAREHLSRHRSPNETARLFGVTTRYLRKLDTE